MENKKTTGWHYSGESNSTRFSNCCGVAITGRRECPTCGAEVVTTTTQAGD